VTTKRYKSLRQLTTQQGVAIEALMEGATHAEAADRAGVHRVTVSKWARGHPAFKAELARRRLERHQQHADRLRDLDAAALESVDARIRENDAEFALKWLKLRGLEQPAPTGLTDADEIIEREVALRRQSAQFDVERDLDPPGLNLEELRSDVEADLARKYDSPSVERDASR
jgi:hypothetical protein